MDMEVLKRGPGRPKKEESLGTPQHVMYDDITPPVVKFPVRLSHLQFVVDQQFRSLVKSGINAKRDNCSIWLMDSTGYCVVDVKHPSGQFTRHHLFGTNNKRGDDLANELHQAG